jgi:hypothetical protein
MGKGGSRVGAGRKSTRRDPQEVLRVVPVPEAPKGLSEREREWWKRLATELDPLELYTASDASSFLSLVRLEALLEAALAGEEVDTDKEGASKAASLSAITGLVRAAAMLRQRFRLDPASRGAVAAPPKPTSYVQGTRDPDDLEPLDNPDAFAPLPRLPS